MNIPSPYVSDPAYSRKYDIRLAMVLGDRAAAFIQQVHYHARWKEETYGELEWRSSLSEWKKTFPCWSEDTLKRMIKECRERGILKVRKVGVNGRIQIWFSLDYEVLNELGREGGLLFDAAQKAANPPQIAPATPSILHPVPPANCTFDRVQNAPHLENISNTSESSISTSPLADARASISAPLGTPERLQQTSLKSRTTFARRFEKTASVQSVAKWWEAMICGTMGKSYYVPLTVVDRSNMKHFVKWCEEANIKPLEFLEWCINNWHSLSNHRLKWASLGMKPKFREIYSLKDKIMEYYRKDGGEEGESTRKEIYTSMSQVPKGHPQYRQIQVLIQQTGRAEVV